MVIVQQSQYGKTLFSGPRMNVMTIMLIISISTVVVLGGAANIILYL